MSFENTYVAPSFLFKTALYLWLISLCLPALYYDNESYFGYEVLVLGVVYGWIGLVFQAYSNIIFLLAIYMLHQHKNPIKLAAFTFILGLSSFFITSIVATGDKGVHDSDIEFKVWGFGFWICSYTLLFISTIWRAYLQSRFNTA